MNFAEHAERVALEHLTWAQKHNGQSARDVLLAVGLKPSLTLTMDDATAALAGLWLAIYRGEAEQHAPKRRKRAA